jgi:hypothetical protein
MTNLMKKIATLFIPFLLLTTIGFTQSRSYITLKERFRGYENVVSLSASGFLTRTMLTFAGEHQINRSIKDVRKVRMTVVPRSAFRSEKVTIDGFIKFAQKDGFEQLFQAREYGDEVTLLRQAKGKKNPERYLLLIDGHSELVAFEMTGYIDHELMLRYMKKQDRHNHQEI